MRAILNIVSGEAAKALGWRARAVRVDKPKLTVEDALRTPTLKEGDGTLFDLITDGQVVKPGYALVIGGEVLRGRIDWQRVITDSEQVFVYNWPMEDSAE